MKRASAKFARLSGPAIALGELVKDERPTTRKTECVRAHVWNASRWNRRCSKCGREEEKDAATKNWK